MVFRNFTGVDARVSFHPLESSRGGSFSSALTATAKSADQGGDIYEFQEEHHARRTNKFACEPPLRHINSSQRCVLWTVAVCSSSWRGNRAWLGDKQLARIMPKDVQRFSDQPGDSLASGTVRRIHTTLHGALKAAQQAHLIASNPTEQIIAPRFSYGAKQILTDDQLDVFTRVIAEDEIW